MGLMIGTDEAGYGPNLGPLVISTTAWIFPESPAETDLWAAFEPVITQKFKRGETRLHAGDSKSVYTPSKGVKQLERSVLSLLGVLDKVPTSFKELYQMVALCAQSPDSSVEDQLKFHFEEQRPPSKPIDPFHELKTEPWFADHDLELPLKNELSEIEQQVEKWKECCEEVQVFPQAAKSEVILTKRFNLLTDFHHSKGITLSNGTMDLLQSVWDPQSNEPALIVADKHGGRNRYDDLLQQITGNLPISCREEGTPLSEYHVHQTRIRFQTKAEAYFPVAWASMLSKYLREVAMELFNQFWRSHLPDLKPTKGYPLDAKRFREEVDPVRQELNITDEIFWRSR